MKPSEFKKIIKEAVKEAIHEELKDILLEAIKKPSNTIIEHIGDPSHLMNHGGTSIPSKKPSLDFRNLNMTTDNIPHTPQYVPPITNTISEGSSLPPGEVSLDQVLGLMNKR